MKPTTVVAELNAALHQCFEEDGRVVLWGEDVLSPYGGAFKVTARLSERFPTRVFTTPISEAAIVGMGVGAALRGLKPVVEIMFGDFLTLAADQLINHAAKFPGMFNGAVSIPLVVRAPMGGYRGYGPTHSQCLEKHFLGVPGLRVVAVSLFHQPGALLRAAILQDPMPVLFVENKSLYPKTPVWQSQAEPLLIASIPSAGLYPVAKVSNFAPPGRPDVTIVAHGGITLLIEEALRLLEAEEIRAEVFVPSDISSRDVSWLLDSCRRTRKLLAIDESSGGASFASQVIANTSLAIGGEAPTKFRLYCPAESVIPADKSMETAMLPSAAGIVNEALSLL